MEHSARFQADTLTKNYPLPESIPENALFVLVSDNRIGIREDSPPRLFFPLSVIGPVPDTETYEYLGNRGTVPLYVIDISNRADNFSYIQFFGLRELAGRLPDEELAIAGLAAHIADYDRTTRFCGKCGIHTVSSRSERAKTCPACGFTTYARLSPAIIVLVRNHETILLVHGKQAPPGRYSLVAGFIEPGETIEHAVHREVMEETGISITNLRYLASEPWPLPNSLMIGFIADYAGGELRPDGIEIESAAWFDRDHLPDLPPRLSIAHALLSGWLGGNLP